MNTHGNNQEKGSIKPSVDVFFPLIGKRVSVALQLHLPFVSDSEMTHGEKPDAAVLFGKYHKEGRAFRDKKKRHVQIFEPAEVTASADTAHVFATDWISRVVFLGNNRATAERVKLIFNRKGVWACCARNGENRVFGFSVEMEHNPYFLYLEYPGISGEFEPLFMKVQNPKDSSFLYYCITAEDTEDGSAILVFARMVNEDDAPAHLAMVEPA